MSAEGYLRMMEGCEYEGEHRLQPSTSSAFLSAASTTSLLSDSDASVFGVDLAFDAIAPEQGGKTSFDFLSFSSLDLQCDLLPGTTALPASTDQLNSRTGFDDESLLLGRGANTLQCNMGGTTFPTSVPSNVISSDFLGSFPPAGINNGTGWSADGASNNMYSNEHGLGTSPLTAATSAGCHFPRVSSLTSHVPTVSTAQSSAHIAQELMTVARAPTGSPLCKACDQEILPGSLSQHFHGASFHQLCAMCSVCSCRPAAEESMELVGDSLRCRLCAINASQAQLTHGPMQVSPQTVNPVAGFAAMPTTSHSPQFAEGQAFARQLTETLVPVSTSMVEQVDETRSDSGPSSPESVQSGGSSLLELSMGTEEKQEQSGKTGADQSKPRGPRTQIKPKQLSTLTTLFDRNPKPSRQAQEQVAKETGLSKRVVQVWFQNKRSKEKRIRQMQMPQLPDYAYMNMRHGNFFGPAGELSNAMHHQHHHPAMPHYNGYHHTGQMRMSNPLLDGSEHCRPATMPKRLMHPASIPRPSDEHVRSAGPLAPQHHYTQQQPHHYTQQPRQQQQQAAANPKSLFH